MRKSRFTDEQIIAILQESVAGGKTGELIRRHGISRKTFYKWLSSLNSCVNRRRVRGGLALMGTPFASMPSHTSTRNLLPRLLRCLQNWKHSRHGLDP